MAEMERIVLAVREYLWGFPMLVMLFGTHIFFTVRLRGIQRKIPLGIRLGFSGKSKKDKNLEKNTLSSYAALSTALAATIGTGNIVGISTAIAMGGPGAVFWCWLTGLLGVATCYGECFLAVKYRVRKPDGSYCGGPMYVLEQVLHRRGLAVMFALFTVLASFGIGSSVQSHSIQMAVEKQVAVSPHITGIIIGVLAGLVIVGGNKKIAAVCTWLVPLMSALYLGGCLWIIWMNRDVFFATLFVIFRDAVQGRAVAGGAVGGTVIVAMRTGISRGLFTNEAGLGSIPMTAATVGEKTPVVQGLISMTGPFWDTVVMCAITGIATVSSILRHPGAYEGIDADGMCFAAFEELPFYGGEILSLSLILFAFATIIGWNVYGTSAVRYLFGERAVGIYQIGYMVAVYLGAVLSLDMVWGLSDLFNSLMAVPNLFCLWMLQKVITRETIDTLRKKGY